MGGGPGAGWAPSRLAARLVHRRREAVQRGHQADDRAAAQPVLEAVLEVCQPLLPPGKYPPTTQVPRGRTHRALCSCAAGEGAVPYNPPWSREGGPHPLDLLRNLTGDPRGFYPMAHSSATEGGQS